jgi:transcription elongation factor GreA
VTSNNKISLTAKGKKKLEEELEHLRTTGREEIAEFMAMIMEEGDISENSGYDDARQKMGALDSRIHELEDILARAVIVDEVVAGSVVLGATVDLEDEKGNNHTFHLVGTHEVDTLKRRISDESPMGQALLNRKVGERVEVNTRKFTIRDIRVE